MFVALKINVGVERMTFIRSEEIQKRANVKPLVAHATKGRLGWYGHVTGKDPEYITSTVTIIRLYLTGMRLSGRTASDGWTLATYM